MPVFSPHSHECGPVEATSHESPGVEGAAPLRTLTSAAPLKRLACENADAVEEMPLRTLTSAAPLKPRPSGLSPRCPCSLRTLTSAAPLKLVAREAIAEQFGASPHSHECGPVEAASPWWRSRAPAWSLRTLTSAAPLKRPGGRKHAGCRQPLRTLTSAAPLKRGLLPVVERFVLLSPHSHECGPVEAILLWVHVRALNCPLRTLTSAAPLKRILRGHEQVAELALSALSRVRPR